MLVVKRAQPLRTIKLVDAETPPGPKWRKGYSSSAIIASGSGVCLILCSIGAAAEYMEGNESLDEWFKGVRLGEGIYRVDFTIEVWKGWTSVGYEYDEELRILGQRLAFKQELEALRAGDEPWDPAEWMTNWDELSVQLRRSGK